ncbi:MAG: hypothetical protein NTZ35_06000 [Ignavibacteriales bacterium]|jgi:hypothetical protein|nr:hypothetical protein [Ignavibacteriales bacterium]
MNTRILVLVLVLLMSTLLAGCIPGGGRYDAASPAGFLSGIWHGWIAPVSLVIGLFDNTTRIYEPNNTGWFYDLGFYIAIIGGFGGLSLTRNKLKRKEVRQV